MEEWQNSSKFYYLNFLRYTSKLWSLIYYYYENQFEIQINLKGLNTYMFKTWHNSFYLHIFLRYYTFMWFVFCKKERVFFWSVLRIACFFIVWTAFLGKRGFESRLSLCLRICLKQFNAPNIESIFNNIGKR